MQIGATYPAIGRGGPLGRAVDMGKGPGTVGAGGLAEVNLISRDRGATGGMAAGDASQAFVRGHGGDDIKQAKSRRFARQPLDSRRIRH